jgi:hypothetical protein
MKSKTDDSRDQYITALSKAGGETSEVALLAELIKEGYLDGVVRGSPEGTPSGAMVMGITVKGRLFLRSLVEEKRKESRSYRLKQALLVAGAFLAGHFADVLKDWLKTLFS